MTQNIYLKALFIYIQYLWPMKDTNCHSEAILYGPRHLDGQLSPVSNEELLKFLPEISPNIHKFLQNQDV